jgi:hypothetical protein
LVLALVLDLPTSAGACSQFGDDVGEAPTIAAPTETIPRWVDDQATERLAARQATASWLIYAS